MTNKKNNNRYKGKQETQPTPKNVVDQQQLAIECFAVHELLKNRTAKLRELQDNELCYILSTKWLREWKEYVGYAALTDNEEDNTSKKDKKYGRRHPGKINTDIVAHESQSREFYTIPAEMTQYQYLNQVINEKKYKDDDYIAVTKDIWETFTRFYEGEEIRRPVRRLKGSTFYDSEPLRCDVIFANMEEEGLEERIKKTSKKLYNVAFSNDKLLLPTIWTIKQLYQFVSEYCSIHFGSSKIHIWKGFHYVATNPLMEHLVEGIRDRKFLVKARELTYQRYGDKDIDKYIKNTHTLIVEIGDILKTDPTIDENIKGYCEECIEKKDLILSCVCKEVIYCSDKCRINDQAYHFDTCPVAFDSDDDEQYEKKIVKDVPLAGIQNIGNTCYMNSIIQMILSLNHIREFFSENVFLDHMNEKELKDNNCMMLRKFSKIVKGLIEQETVTPWPLKGQIDYNLTPFKGDKQHDANDFLINFLNLINDYLKKQGDKAYHKIFEPFVGEFYSKVICPNCQVQSENNQIFLQISLPIKSKVKQQLYQYAVIQNPIKYTKGKSQFYEDWSSMKSRVDAKDSLVFTIKEPEGLVRVDQQEKTPEKVTKGLKGELLYYKNVCDIEGEHIFIFSLVTTKVICGSKMKSPYGLPIPISVDHMTKTLGSFWLQIIKHFFFQNENIVQQAERFDREYFAQIENQIKNQKLMKEEVKQEKTGDVYQQPEDPEAKKIVDAYNLKLKLFAERIGIEVYVNDIKKSRNICKFCNKKCSGCDLPKIFDKAFEDYFDDKYSQVRFEVYLRETLQIESIQEDKCNSGQPSIHDCLSLFTQPEQLDEQNAWYCQNCDSMALALKQLHIKAFPPLLVIHLNRFKNIDGKKMKNSEPILYEEYQEFEGVEYRLVGVVIHEGSMDAGHYWAIGLREDKYYIFNDAKVTEVDKIFNKNAYILLYGRVDFIK